MDYNPNTSVDGLGIIWLEASIVATVTAVICYFLFGGCAHGDEPMPVSNLIRIESGGNAHALGDNGHSRGLYQMQWAAWSDVSRRRRANGQCVHAWSLADHPVIARAYAENHLAWLCRQFRSRTGRSPSRAEQYALWNLGLTGFARCQFDIVQCPATTRRAAATLEGK